jgi:hypothetical protein
MAVAATAAEAARSVAEGADLIDLTGADPAEVAAFRAEHPGVPVCAGDQAANLTWDPAVAKRTGARLLCASKDEAVRSGLPAGQVLVEASPASLLTALAGGHPVLVNLPGGAQPDDAQHVDAQHVDARAGEAPPGAAALAVAALSAWLGAAVVRTRYPLPVRRALDLTDSVRGIRPPARTVRGLA